MHLKCQKRIIKIIKTTIAKRITKIIKIKIITMKIIITTADNLNKVKPYISIELYVGFLLYLFLSSLTSLALANTDVIPIIPMLIKTMITIIAAIKSIAKQTTIMPNKKLSR